MGDAEEIVNEWKIGDAVRETLSRKIWQIVELGVGDCESYRKANGEVFYDNQGSDRVCLQFVEQSTKVKRGKKYVVVQGRKDTLWIDKATTEFENESYAVRVSSSLRVAEERDFDRNMANDQPFLDYVDNDDYDSADDRSLDNHSEDGLDDVNGDDDEDADDNNGEDLDVDVLAERAEGAVENQVRNYQHTFVPSCDQLSSSYPTNSLFASQTRKRRRGNEGRVVK